MGLVSFLYKLARAANTGSKVTKPKKMARRIINKKIGKWTGRFFLR